MHEMVRIKEDEIEGKVRSGLGLLCGKRYGLREEVLVWCVWMKLEIFPDLPD
jgi:hypothetical protein